MTHALTNQSEAHKVRGGRAVCTDKLTGVATAAREEAVRQVLVGVFILIISFSYSQHVSAAVLLCRASFTLP